MNQSRTETKHELVLVHGIFVAAGTDVRVCLRRARQRRANALVDHGPTLGVRHYEWRDGQRKGMANRALRRARGTAPAVDAVEILEVDEQAFWAGLQDERRRALWRDAASCDADGFDAGRSFILVGAARILLEGDAGRQRVLWFGNGLAHLSKAEFIDHYTGQHGPLVAGHAQALGLRRYRQVPGERGDLAESLRDLGLGQAAPPAVFAELEMGRPSLSPGGLRAWRAATREISADEKRHIDFSRSMLLLA